MSSFDNDDAVVTKSNQVNLNNVTPQKSVKALSTSSIVNNLGENKAVSDKLENFDKIDALNTQLINEKNDLQSKLEEYIVDSQAKQSTIEELTHEIENLKKQIADLELAVSNLTFENTKLTVQLNTAKNSMSSSDATSVVKVNPPPRCYPTRRFSSISHNGYTDWN